MHLHMCGAAVGVQMGRVAYQLLLMTGAQGIIAQSVCHKRQRDLAEDPRHIPDAAWAALTGLALALKTTAIAILVIYR